MTKSTLSIFFADKRRTVYGSKGFAAVWTLRSSSLSAQEQDKVELFGGYSYMRFAGTNLNGWEASGQYKFLDWLGGVADFDGHYGSFDGIGTSTHTFLFGPQISRPSRVSPFGHLLMTTRVKKKTGQSAARKGSALDLVAIGRRIRELRGFDIEQAEFARTLGISQSQLSKYERGVTEPPLSVLVQLKERFGKNLDWFVTGRV